MNKVLRVGAFLAALCAVVMWWAWSPSRQETSPEQAYKTALDAVESGDWETVRMSAQQLDEHPAFKNHARLLAAVIRLRSGAPQAALNVFKKISPEGELRYDVLRFTGEAFYALHRLADAEILFRLVASEFPDKPAGYRWLGAVYYDIGAMDQALGMLNRLAELTPDDYQPHWLQGVIYSDFERYREAAEAYRAALERHPPPAKRETIQTSLLVSLVKSNDYAAAVSLIPDTESLHDGTALASLAQAYWSLGEFEKARDALERAEVFAPEDRDVRYWRAMFAQHDDRTEDAIPILQSILSVDPHDTESRYQLAMAYRQLGRMDEYRAAIAEKEKSDALIEQLHESNLKAIASPGDPAIRDRCADLCEALGKPRLAQMWRKAAQTCRELASTPNPFNTSQ